MKRLTFLLLLVWVTACTPDGTVVVLKADTTESSKAVNVRIEVDGQTLGAFSVPPGVNLVDTGAVRQYGVRQDPIVTVMAAFEGEPESEKILAFRAVQNYPAEYPVVVEATKSGVAIHCYDGAEPEPGCPIP